MTSLKLCLATQLYHPYYAGGAMRYRSYLPGLRQRQICTEVFTSTPSQERTEKFRSGQANHQTQPGQLLPVETDQNSPVYRVQLAEERAWRRVMQYGQALVDFCQQLDTQPDVVQFLPLPPWSVPALQKLRRLHIPLAYAYNLINNPQRSLAGRLRQMAAKRLQFPLLDCIIVQSSVMAQTLRNEGVNGRIEIIPNGVDTVRFAPTSNTAAREIIRQSLNIEPMAPIILYVGAIEPRKGSDLLFDAWAKLAPEFPQAHLVLAGPRLDQSDPMLAHFHHRLEGIIDASGTRDRVHFVGRVGNVERYFQAADLFVFPSRREGLPNVIMEAMATGLPVVTTPFIGFADELGQPEEQFLLAEHDASHLYEQMRRVLLDENLQARLSRNGRIWATTHLDIENILDRYAALYRELAETAKQRN
ncbi:MAG: glycosyltransferase family 4 protein [Ardenticatenaceae bacterium]|nr:glycosyltransferase family 4 protein [Ardenticatenaceae bacterium]